MPNPKHTPLVTNPYYAPGGPASSDSATGQAVGPGDTKVNQFLSKLREAVPGKYAYWPHPSGYQQWSAGKVKSHGLSCSGFLNWGLAQIGMQGVGGTYDYAAAIGRKPIDPNKVYPVGTFVVSTTGPEGHVAVVSGPGNRLLQSDTASGINEGKTIKAQMPFVHYQYAGSLPALGTGNVLSNNQAPGGGLDVGGMLGNLTDQLGNQIANGLMMAIKYLYGYMILRPWDFTAGFSYELVVAIKNDVWMPSEESADTKNAAKRNESQTVE